MPNWFTRKAPVVPVVEVREVVKVVEARSMGVFGESQFGRPAGESSLIGTGNEYYAGLLSHPAAYRAATLLANLVASLPFRAFVDRDDNVVEQVAPTPVVLTNPCPPLTFYTAVYGMVLDYVANGNGIAIITDRDADGTPTAILPVPARYVQVRWNEADGEMPWLHNPSQRLYRIGNLELGPNDVIHVMGPMTPGALRGMGIIETLGQSMRLGRALNHQALAVAENAAVPTGVLKDSDPNVTPDDLDDLKRAFQGAQRERTVLAVNGNVDYTPIGWNPNDAQLLESRQFSLTEYSLAFGLPPHFLSATPEGGMTYSTTALEAQELLRFGKPAELLAAFEAEFSRHMAPGVCVRADVSHLVRADLIEMSKYYTAAIAGGWLTANDVRAELGYPPLPDPIGPDIESAA